MGTSTISTGPFSMSQTVDVYQRVHDLAFMLYPKRCRMQLPIVKKIGSIGSIFWSEAARTSPAMKHGPLPPNIF